MNPELEKLNARIKELNNRLRKGEELTQWEMTELGNALNLAEERRTFGYCTSCGKPFVYGDVAFDVRKLAMGSSQGNPETYTAGEPERYHQVCYFKL